MDSIFSDTVLPVAGIAAALALFLWLDLRLFAAGHDQPSMREATIWSVGWLVLSLGAALVVWQLRDGHDALLYTTVYLIERSLSLDNVFVFLLLFAYFGIAPRYRGRLIVWGVVFALIIRGLAIVGGIELIERFEAALYVLGGLLLVLAARIYRGVENVDPHGNFAVRAVRRLFPVHTGDAGGRWFTHEGGRLHTTPIFLCLSGIVFADIAFAIDSIPAAFAITREPLLIWMGNVFALLGLRALFVLVEGLVRRFRYLDQTIAVVLGAVALKLLAEQATDFHIDPLPSLGIVATLFTIGIVLSLVGDKRATENPAVPGGTEGPKTE